MNVVIVDAVHTPFAKRNGVMRGWHAVDLAAHVLRALRERSVLEDFEADTILGCATPIGEQALNIARNAMLAADWSEFAMGFTVDAQAASGQIAVHTAIARVASGMADVCIGGGLELTSHVPSGASTGTAVGKPFGPSVHQRYEASDGLRSPGHLAENLATAFGLSRDTLDAYAERSIANAGVAQAEGVYKAQILPTAICGETGTNKPNTKSLEYDELASASGLKKLKPLFEAEGMVTAGNFAALADGAAAVVVATTEWCERNHVQPLARVIRTRECGGDVLHGGTGIDLLKDLTAGNAVDRLDVHENSAATILALMTEIREEPQINPDGGALAYGDPAGASGARLIGASAHALANGRSERAAVLTAGTASLWAGTLLEAIT